jgi:hypothetical protein
MPRSKERAHGRPSAFDGFHRGLVAVHGELRQGAQQILRFAAGDSEDEQRNSPVAPFCQTLLDHHKSEDAFFFPAFRRAGRLRASDVAFLDRRDAEHVDIHRVCLELKEVDERRRRAAIAASAWRASVALLAQELADLSAPHFQEEERTLTPAHLPTLISERELVAVFRDMGENWHRR